MSDDERSAAARLLATLEALGRDAERDGRGLTVGELARVLGRDKSVVSRHLRHLVSLGLVERSTEGRHRLGWRLFTLAAKAGDRRLLLLAPAVMRRLSSLLQERVHLSVLHGAEVLTILSVSSQRAIEATDWVGRTVPVHCTSAGQVLVFDHSDDEVRRLVAGVSFPGPGPRAAQDVDDWLARVKQARERGFALVDGEMDADLVATAAPVRDFGGRLVAALNVSAPAYRLRDRIDVVGAQVADAAAHLSAISSGVEPVTARPWPIPDPSPGSG